MQAPQLPADNRSSAGFTLIEILVAFTVATLLLGALYQVFSAGLRSSASAEHYADAVLLAESGLDALVGTAVALYEIEVRVAWREGVRERAVLLSTVRPGPRERPR